MPADSGRYPSGQRGQTVNLLANAFGGSNPPLPTTPAVMVSGAERVAGRGPRRAPATKRNNCGNSSAVERQPSKLGVAGSNPVSRSRFRERDERVRRLGGDAHVAQSAERVLGKDEVSGSIPDMGSTILRERPAALNPDVATR
jgi:hypothetical protein